MAFKHTIWNHDIGDLKDWENEDGSPMTFEEADELNNEYFYDERANLNKELGRDIICIASLGLWDGRVDAHRMLGTNLRDVLQSFSDGYCAWGVDEEGELVGTEAHHDGTNHYIYRVMKEGFTEDDLYEANFSANAIADMTESLGKQVADIYGWVD